MSGKVKIFIDGSEGTTGLRIHERFAEREDVELLPISSELRKDGFSQRPLLSVLRVLRMLRHLHSRSRELP